MEALKIIQSAKNGVLHILVPEHFNNTELEVIVIPLEKTVTNQKPPAAVISKFFGSAKYPDTIVNLEI